MNLASEYWGKKNIYGFSIGVLMLKSSFPRVPGEIGNATTFDFPVLYRYVDEANAPNVVHEGRPEVLLEPYKRVARELESEGVGAITTNCGYLAKFQKELAASVNVPVFTSSLMQIPLAYSMLKPDQVVGVMTFCKSALRQEHFEGAGAWGIPMAVVGLEEEGEGHFYDVIINDRNFIDVEKCRKEHISAARRLVDENPRVGTIVLECTNMPPYAADIHEVTGLPVFDIVTMMRYMHSNIVKPRRGGYM
ncbi:MAG: aspartate/glutamate racemase family protein [Synergistales bacterium]|nr:aspartate/glutamate racemase family protein [Synergistales bacterium]